jgi:predicted nucleic acid-binding protein
MIVDCSVILGAFFPDENQRTAQAVLRDHILGRVKLKAPNLLLYEVSNAVWQAERRGRIAPDQTDEIIAAIAGLQIEIHPLEWGEMLPLARQFDRSAYDSAYLTLAQKLEEKLITADERLYNAVRSSLEWVIPLEDYSIQS